MKKLALLLLVAILLTACQPAASPQSTKPAAVVPTMLSPTEPPAPLPTNRPAPTPTLALGEVLAGSVDDLVGRWWFSTGGLTVEFKADGTYRATGPEFIGVVDEGNFTFDAGKITFDPGSGRPATYEAYVNTQDGNPVWLRLQVVGSDPYRDRVNTFKSRGKFQNP
jgi:hypothetical protein